MSVTSCCCVTYRVECLLIFAIMVQSWLHVDIYWDIRLLNYSDGLWLKSIFCGRILEMVMNQMQQRYLHVMWPCHLTTLMAKMSSYDFHSSLTNLNNRVWSASFKTSRNKYSLQYITWNGNLHIKDLKWLIWPYTTHPHPEIQQKTVVLLWNY